MAYGTSFAQALPNVLSAEPAAATALKAWLLEAETKLEAKVTPAGFTMNADLDFLTSYGATNVQHVGLSAASALKTGASHVGKLYRFGGELYYTNASGTTTKLTNAGAVNVAAVGAIGGDYTSDGNATVDYTTATTLYRMLSHLTNLARATVEVGALRVYGTGNNPSFRTTIAVPSLAASYTFTLPSAVPGSTSLLQWTSAGAVQSTRDPSIDTLTASGQGSFGGKLACNGDIAHPSRFRHVSAGDAMFNGSWSDPHAAGATGEITASGAVFAVLPLPMEEGERIKSVRFIINQDGGSVGDREVSLGYYNNTIAAVTFPGGSWTMTVAASGGAQEVNLNVSDTVVSSPALSGALVGMLYAKFQPRSGDKWFGVRVEYDRP